MKYQNSDIGSFIQLEKGERIHLKTIFGTLGHLVNWEMNSAYGSGELKFSTPALLCSIDTKKQTAVVRLPFDDTHTEYTIEASDEARSLMNPV